MTIKEAFESLSGACAKGMKNPFFVMKRLKESFADVADNVVVGGSSASDVSYDNTTSHLTATNVQAAIDEVASTITEALTGNS